MGAQQRFQEAAPAEPYGGAVEVHLRNGFYRDGFYRAIGTAVIIGVVAVMSIAANVWLVTHRPLPRYFAVDAQGHLTQMVPVESPMMSTSELTTWATQTAIDAYSYDFANYRTQISKLAPRFTDDGYTNFLAALKSSGNLDAVRERRLVVSATPVAAPVVVASGQLSGRYAWKVQLPLLVTYQSASESMTQNVVVTMLIVRESVVVHPIGVAVAQFIARVKQ